MEKTPARPNTVAVISASKKNVTKRQDSKRALVLAKRPATVTGLEATIKPSASTTLFMSPRNNRPSTTKEDVSHADAFGNKLNIESQLQDTYGHLDFAAAMPEGGDPKPGFKYDFPISEHARKIMTADQPKNLIPLDDSMLTDIKFDDGNMSALATNGQSIEQVCACVERVVCVSE